MNYNRGSSLQGSSVFVDQEQMGYKIVLRVNKSIDFL